MKLMAGTRRFSKQRQLIFDTVCSLHCHPTADDIYSIVKGRIPAISLGTVYRNLNILAEEGLIRKISFGKSTERYDARTNPHYHMICFKCGQVVDIDLPYQKQIDEYANGLCPHQITGHDIVFSGICADCNTKQNISDFENRSHC